MTDISAQTALAAKVSFLRESAFPSPPDVIETHMSWVFLTDGHAYKLKKPVHHSYLDYRTLDARRRDCEAEIALNQALAPGVYLRVATLTRDDEGALAIDGRGEVVEWLVIMRRLPDALMLERQIASGDIDPEELSALVGHLVDFYRTTSAAPTAPEEYRRAILHVLETDREGLLRPAHLLDEGRVRHLTDTLHAAIGSHADLDDRAARVVDGHGDLRPEHVLLGPHPLVIDRITFDRRLREVDPLYDLALLRVECEMAGAIEVGEDIIRLYRTEAADPIADSTSHLYGSLRAMTRARLSIAHLDDGARDAERWRDRTDRYLAIAEDHLARFTADGTEPPV